jgi:recombination protein RecA
MMSKAKSAAGGKSPALAGLQALIQKHTKKVPVVGVTGTMPHIPTGVCQIDTLIGGELTEDKKGMICPGLPRGRLIEVFGAESSGKTTLALKFVSMVQKAGGSVLYLDYEHAIQNAYAKAVGVDLDNLLRYEPDTLEEGVKMIAAACVSKADLVIVDSVAAMIPMAEIDRSPDEAAKVGALASALSRLLPKIVKYCAQSGTTVVFVNQTRSLISANSHSGEDNTSGGKALKFYASLRLKTTRIRSDFVEVKDTVTLKKKKQPYGNLVQIKSVKNKIVGHQGHTAEIFIRYGFGVDEYLSLIESAIPRKIIQQNSSAYVYGTETFKGKERVRKFLIDNPKAYDEIRQKVVKSLLAEAPDASAAVDGEDISSTFEDGLSDDDLFSGQESLTEETVMAEVEQS